MCFEKSLQNLILLPLNEHSDIYQGFKKYINFIFKEKEWNIFNDLLIYNRLFKILISNKKLVS